MGEGLLDKVCVVGAGSWGTAVAGLVAPHVGEVSVWAHSQVVVDGINEYHANPRYLMGYELPDNVTASSRIADAARDAGAVVLVVPSRHVRRISSDLSGALGPEVPVMVLAKGIELETGELMTEVVADELGHPERVGALSGPNHAEEVCRGKLSAAVLAADDRSLAERMQRLFISRDFRVYVSADVVGVEVCAAVKNVIAIACGAAAGLGAGDNTLAVIMTRGLAEISRVVSAKGGDPMTCMGLAGMGDLIATCTSPHSRNRTFGRALVDGITLEQYERDTHMVVEGAQAARSVLAFARGAGVEVPITQAVHGMLYEGYSPDTATSLLVDRLPHEEFYGLDTTATGKALV